VACRGGEGRVAVAMAMARRGREPGYRIVVAVVVMVVCVLLALIAVAESARPWTAREREVGMALGGQEEKQRRGLLVVEEEEDAVPPSGTVAPTQEEEASPRKPHIECDEVSSDVESCSPPAQRQTDRSMWGMSKRLVPTGPNPLHN
jgi:hypothetical protein